MRILLFVRFFLLYFVVSLFSFCCCFFQLSGTLSHRILIFLLYFLYRLRKFSPYILKIFVITCYPVLWHHVTVILVSRLFFWGVFFSILSNYCSPPLYWYVFFIFTVSSTYKLNTRYSTVPVFLHFSLCSGWYLGDNL